MSPEARGAKGSPATRRRPGIEFRNARRESTATGPRANQVAGLAEAIAEIRPLAQPADALLHDFFRQRKAMGQHDRALIADGLFAYFRRKRSLEALAESQHPRHLALAVLVRELGLGVRELEGAIGADDVAWLREFKSRLAT